MPLSIFETLTITPDKRNKRNRDREECFEQFCRKDPVMLFSMGKTGSTALARAIDEYYGDFISLEKLPITYGNRVLRRQGEYRKSDFCDDLIYHYIVGTRDGPRNRSRLKIIVPIREPIGRDVASFYQGAIQNFLGVRRPTRERIPLLVDGSLGHYHRWLPLSVRSGIKRGLLKLRYSSTVLRQSEANQGWVYNDGHIQQLNNLGPKQLRDIYLEIYFHRCKRHYTSDTSPRESAINWFDNNVKGPLHLDVYARKFPANGVGYYRINHADMMVLECSLDNERKEELIKDFLGIEEFKVGYANVTDAKLKALADSYALFKREVKFPKWYLDKMLHSQYFRHFYTRGDEERLRQQWAE